MFGQPSSTFSIVGDILTNWFTLVLLMAGLGVAAGLLIFVFLFPGKPKIGVIDIPFTVITDRTTNLITDHLEYARRDDSIKGVVIKLTSPGGGAAASERLYRETERLAEEKPVVVVHERPGRQRRVHDGHGRHPLLRPDLVPGGKRGESSPFRMPLSLLWTPSGC